MADLRDLDLASQLEALLDYHLLLLCYKINIFISLVYMKCI